MVKIIAALWLACSAGVTAGAAAADVAPNCAGLADVLAAMALKFHEQPLFMGLVTNGARVIVLVNPDLTTWTALVADQHGRACLVASGQSWAAGGAQLKGIEG